MGINEREQAISLGQICDTLVQLNDRRAIGSIRELVNRTINVNARAMRGKRRDNLAVGDPDIPGSIVYGAAIRTFAQFADPSMLDFILPSATDFQPDGGTPRTAASKRKSPSGQAPTSDVR